MVGRRDDFSPKVVRIVGERAGYICSNPLCRRPTIGPHSDPHKSLTEGEAAHICAAAPNGPRYSANQTSEQRGDISNAIWLCTICSRTIDKDPDAYPVDKLMDWRKTHEDWIRNGGIVPPLPAIQIANLQGLSLPEVPGVITGQDCEVNREHVLTFTNRSDGPIHTILANVQLPEPVIHSAGQWPPGTTVSWFADRPRMVTRIVGNGKAERTAPPLPSRVYKLQVSQLSARSSVQIAFITSLETEVLHGRQPGESLIEKSAPDAVRFLIMGSFQFDYLGASLERKFFSQLHYDSDSRDVIASDVIEAPTDGMLIVKHSFFS